MELRDLRLQRKLSLRQLEILTGLNRARISELETGKRNPKAAELQLLGRELGFTLDQVVYSNRITIELGAAA